MRPARILLRLALLFCLLPLAACDIYRVDVQQGNVITESMLSELKPGMDQLQVRTILGTPLLRNPWSDDRWVYVYSFKPAYGEREQRHVYVIFDKEGKMVGVQGAVQPKT